LSLQILHHVLRKSNGDHGELWTLKLRVTCITLPKPLPVVIRNRRPFLFTHLRSLDCNSKLTLYCFDPAAFVKFNLQQLFDQSVESAFCFCARLVRVEKCTNVVSDILQVERNVFRLGGEACAARRCRWRRRRALSYLVF